MDGLDAIADNFMLTALASLGSFSSFQLQSKTGGDKEREEGVREKERLREREKEREGKKEKGEAGGG